MEKKTSIDEIKFVAPEQEAVEIPKQPEFYKLPVRFGSVPVDEAPLGWEVETRARQTKVTRFQQAYPVIRLPFQEVQRVEFGHKEEFLKQNEKDPKLKELFPTGANRLFFGDCLHVMRQLPSNSIDLIYIDPPFFSGRNYNVIFGDKNEVRSFSDIWEGGMPGYLVWLNARLFEMKRLLKKTGSIYVHLDWHASHYVKGEMDRIFGNQNLRAEIVWEKIRVKKAQSDHFPKVHDVIFCYSKSGDYIYQPQYGALDPKYIQSHYSNLDSQGRPYQLVSLIQGGAGPARRFGNKVLDPPPGKHWIWGQERIDEAMAAGLIVFTSSGRPRLKRYLEQSKGTNIGDLWTDVPPINSQAAERIGYPTQKPEELVERILSASSREGSVIGDFFCGGGTTPAVAQRLKRRWIACDQSRIAVAITADRVTRVVEEKIGKVFPVPDFTVEHWGVYEIPKLEKYSAERFREFVVRAFGGKPESVSPSIHGTRHGIPLYVGEPSRATRITKDDVIRFAEAIFKERRSNFGTMLGWNFGPDAKRAAEILAARENKRVDFVRLTLVRLESDDFREHARSLHKNYGELLTFVQPPEVRVNVKRVGKLRYEFDVSESVSLNKDGVLANVQWDFDYRDRFSTTPGYAFLRDKKTGRAELIAQYEFPQSGKRKIACSVQDDQGGEKNVVMEIDVR